ncbi:TetR/AcrR family transcriptional regulator [Actinomycetospora endophytica]|uniref:TetR/AcrR family transcriptional regulator n=1 Tax=Actinomycetospora endophytica TaxID=2291215 RepID=A0ABS8P8V2_9PSEU|nr:TetR/AcrR family transcriptional regulator [Actinomycetospora endophytica]MCD2194715.1 TetR/AcrR family transcriptional regulator [Actinomycetospora endophytica]
MTESLGSSAESTSRPLADARRPRGRPRRDIDRDAVADAVAELFAEGGYDAVSIADTAVKLSISRSTLYRTVPTKEELLGILFERGTRKLTTEAREAVARQPEFGGERLRELVRIQITAAVQMRDYISVFFGGALPGEVRGRWRECTREYENLWHEVVEEAMAAGLVERADPVVTTNLMFGMCVWVSRWYRPQGSHSADDIADVAIGLLRLAGPARPGTESTSS